ncbi:hypothetical protein BJY01DRAFT_154425 [Aspergillus pseudoustus]|uniref:Uncharacterized protein n=1 Tax=Aspergillus pseudoustus TaxID=1810923 RepID=A0ABR4K8E8_9EURO
MLRKILDLVLTTLAVQSVAQVPYVAAGKYPQAPELSFLYTAYVDCKGSIMSEDGPRGKRQAIPIVGGNFTGPRLSGMLPPGSQHRGTGAEMPRYAADHFLGQILDLGADWGTADPKTGIFSADTRYNLRTDDGADIFVQTSGPTSPLGRLHLRLLFETGHKEYYWLNNIVAIGTLTPVEVGVDSSVLRIDAWNFARDWNRTPWKG